MTLSGRLKQLRVERGWTQNDMAKRTGLGRRTISYNETHDIQRLPANVLFRYAQALNMKPENLYAKKIEQHQQTPQEILDRLRLATPKTIPVYDSQKYPHNVRDFEEPSDYIYKARCKVMARIEAYAVHGDCLQPKVSEGDIIIVDRDGSIDNGDVVACLADNEFHVLQVRKVADEVWLENNHRKFKYEECQETAPAIECIKKFK
jgi:transcriptional regulator with XRE-family HTH domain